MKLTETERVRSRALEMLAQGQPKCDVLTYLVREAEAVSHGGAVCSVLLLDEEGLLRNGASPGLPADYLAAIDRLKPDAAIGTCAAAAATGKIVITPNLLSDAGWKELRHLPLALGLAAAWSVPIAGRDGRILGTFGTYFREPRRPRPDERSFVESLAGIAAIVIERARESAGAREVAPSLA